LPLLYKQLLLFLQKTAKESFFFFLESDIPVIIFYKLSSFAHLLMDSPKVASIAYRRHFPEYGLVLPRVSETDAFQ